MTVPGARNFSGAIPIPIHNLLDLPYPSANSKLFEFSILKYVILVKGAPAFAICYENVMPKPTRDYRWPMAIPVPMLRHQPSLIRPLFFTFIFCVALYYFFTPGRQSLYSRSYPNDGYDVDADYSDEERHVRGPGPPSSSAFENLSLDELQCRETFPDLTYEIDRAVANGPFKLEKQIVKGPLIAAIRGGELWILQEPGKGELSQKMKEVPLPASPPHHRQSSANIQPPKTQRQLAALHQIHRALLTSPHPLIPDTVLALTVTDTPLANTFSYARPATDPSGTKAHTFPMPHFAFWTWRSPFLSSLPAAAGAISAVEGGLGWAAKDRRAVWRGTSWFSNGAASNPRLRQSLVRLAGNQSWADVQSLAWTTNAAAAANGLPVEAFCRYRYVVHTEGVSYSGRFNFHVMCRSVVVTPPLEWMEMNTHLVKPVYSSVLLGGMESALRDDRFPGKRARETWPVRYDAGEANMVFVRPDWSDLEETVRWLEGHPEVAEGIAERQRRLFAGGGYVSLAAETCYWRALIKGWSEVVRYEEGDWEEGVRFEEYVLKASA